MLGAWLGVAACVSACSINNSIDNSAQGTSQREEHKEVVASVDGDSISMEDVRRAMEQTGLGAPAALQRLEARTLLLQEAKRRGVLPDAIGQRRVTQALVQALLIEDIEGTPVPEASIREAFEVQRQRFSTPERRASVHILAVVKPNDDAKIRDAAFDFTQRMIEQLATKEFSQVAKEARKLGAEQPFEVKTEAVPAVSQDGPLVRPYMEALFGASGLGVIVEPVETRFGWHAIVVTAITPATFQAYEDVRDMLRLEVSQAQRKSAVDALLKEIKGRLPVQVHEATLLDLSRIQP